MRRKDWPEQLLDTIEAHKRPFAWGDSDCLTFAADCVKAMTDVDPLGKWRGKYKTEHQADQLLKKAKFDNIIEAIAALYPETPIAMAHRGDIGVVQDKRGLAAVIFIDDVAVGKGETGLFRVSRDRVMRAFAVR